MRRRCETCRFWEECEEGPPQPHDDYDPRLGILSKLGYCRRYPPAFDPPEGRNALTVTEYNDWCGEWKKRQGSDDGEPAEG